MSALSIVHVVFSSRIAGGEHHCIDLANAQAALGHRVQVIGSAGSAVQGALHRDVAYHGLALPLLRGWRVRQLARRLGADVVHGHLGPACKAVAWVANAARLGTLHVGYKAHHHRRLDGLVCVNGKQQQSLLQFDGLHRVIHNWAPDRDAGQPVQAAPNAPSLREQLGLSAHHRIIGCVGRLHTVKGMDVLIRAFQKQAPADTHLVLLGEGPQRSELEALRQDDPRIHLLGFRWDVDQLLSQMDLCVSASREEQFPLAILEAMKAGVPIVATATDGASEMLHDQPAMVVPIDDVEAMGSAIHQTLTKATAVGKGRMRYCLDRFDRSAAIMATIGLYHEVLAHQAAIAAGIGLPI